MGRARCHANARRTGLNFFFQQRTERHFPRSVSERWEALGEFGGGERLLGLTVCCPMLLSQSPLTTRALLGSFPWRLPSLLFFVLQKVRSAEALPVLGTIPTPLAGRGHSFAQRPITAWLLL